MKSTRSRTLLLGLAVVAQIGCAIDSADQVKDSQTTMSPSAIGTAVEIEAVSPTVSIPDLRLSDVIEIRTRVTNRSDVPLIADDSVVVFSVNYVIVPVGTEDRSGTSGDAASSRILGQKDLFVATVPTVNSGEELSLSLGSVALAKVIADFSNKQVTPGAANLRISSMVLRSILLDRNGKEVSRHERSIDLTSINP